MQMSSIEEAIHCLMVTKLQLSFISIVFDKIISAKVLNDSISVANRKTKLTH